MNRKRCCEEEVEEGRWDVHVVNSQPSASSLSLPPLSHSLFRSLLHTHPEKNTHLLFRLSPSHSQPLLLLRRFSILLALSLLRLIKGSVIGRARSSLNWGTCASLFGRGSLDRSQDVAPTEKGLPFHLSLDNQSGGKREGCLRGGTLLVFVQLLWWEISWQQKPKSNTEESSKQRNHKTRGDAVW